MATLVLSTVGTALGGPIGGAIGSLIGQTLDRQMFGPGPRTGPRLGDLSVQTSTYGAQVPRIYGTMRVAGTVVWATELKESDTLQGGAKGQPDTLVYSYSVSLAVALSSRVAQRIKRIWADGKLLRGAAGDFKVKTGFRFYPGSEAQEVDPLIASVEGIDAAPAYRGLALAVFEDLELAEFGNRIPFLTFEIEADAAAPTLGSVLADASGGLLQHSSGEAIAGYAAYGSSRRLAVEPLIDHFGVHLFDDGDRVRAPSAVLPAEVPDDELGCGAGAEAGPLSERSQAPARSLPNALAISYYDPDRDYQGGRTRASAGGSGGVEQTVELAVVMGAARAKALAQSSMARRWAERDKLVLRTAPHWLQVEPGSLLRTADGASWRIRQVAVEQLVVRIELQSIWDGIAAASADPGRPNPAPDVVAQPTKLAVFDLPDLATGRHDVPVLHVGACKPSGWSPVPLEVSAGGQLRAMLSAHQEAVLGTAVTALGSGQAAILDLANTVEVELFDSEHWLESRDDEALVNGANLAVLGQELIQFGSAVATGPGRFRLSRLLRGRRGSEWAAPSHLAGEAFAVLTPNSFAPIELPLEALGSQVQVTAHAVGDLAPAAVGAVAAGEALRPPRPVHLRTTRSPDGALAVTWVRRSRIGWGWLDGVDAGLGESVERYRVQVRGGAGSLDLETEQASVTISSTQVSSLGAGQAEISIVQVGDYAASRPATLLLSL